MQAIILLLPLLLGSVSSELYYHITPSPNVTCTSTSDSVPCLTLTEFLNNSNGSNTTLIFLSGNHRLEAELTVDNIAAFSMLSISANSSGVVKIICGYFGTIKFENIYRVHIAGLTFYGCTNTILNLVDHFFLENSCFIGHIGKSGAALELFKTTTTVIRTSFHFNVAKKLYNIDCPQYQNHGQARAGGAIVSIKSNITILDSVFEGNSAVAGGAIFHTNCNATITNDTVEEYKSPNNCKSGIATSCGDRSKDPATSLYIIDFSHINITHCDFINNYATGPGIGGGAVYVVAANVSFSHSRFLDNLALHDSGGVVFADAAFISIMYTVFINNSAQFYGGVLLAKGLSLIDITYSKFIDNYCTSAGGIIMLDKNNHFGHLYATVTVAHSQFSNNSGGIITFNVVNEIRSLIIINISHSQFSNNLNKKFSGVVNILDLDRDSSSDLYFELEPGLHYDQSVCILNINDSRFINNKGKEGGVIFEQDCSAYINVSHSVFVENSCSSRGGVMSIYENKKLCIIHSEFVNNKATQSGGIACIYSGAIFITHNKFINNVVLLAGGVMVVLYSYDIKIVYNQFIENSARRGGVVYMALNGFTSNGPPRSAKIVTVARNEFTNNSAELDGGVLYTNKYNLSISYCNFISNSASSGGALWSQDSNIVEVIGSNFLHGKVLNSGGAINIMLKGALNISKSSFNHNVGKDGGVIYADQTNTEIIESIFEDNEAKDDGGAIFIKEAILRINESQFYNNSAGKSGGVALLQQRTLNVHGSSFNDNLAGQDGGVFSIFRVNAIISVSSHIQNSATHDGGVIKAYQSVIDISVGCHFYGNSAGNSGGVIRSYHSITNISECVFSSNLAKNDGGVINGYQGSLTVYEGSSFTHNAADNDGGVIHSYELDIRVIGNGFEDNYAKNRGGVSFIYQGSSVLMMSIFSYNKAVEGGVIYVDQGQLKIESVSCVRNEANEGGVIHMGQTNTTIKYSAFSQNLANGNGGAWFTKSSSVFFDDVYFRSNTAETGGIVYSNKCNLKSVGPLVVHNTTADVGAMYLYGSTAQFSGKTEISNSIGSCLVYNSNITFGENTMFTNCSEKIANENPEMLEGGALTLFKGIANFHTTAVFINNDAKNGGAIQATESKIYVYGAMSIENNSAVKSGGGVHLDMTELYCQFNSSLKLSGNVAIEKGGGIHAIASVINVNGSLIRSNDKNITLGVFFIKNKSNKGGGLYLETSAKLYILKSVLYTRPHYIVHFIDNSADYGGAVYVSDDSNSGLCDPHYTFHFDAKECLIQIIAVESSESSLLTTDQQSMKSILFSRNSADISGSSLFGGLIDRCKVLHFTEKLMYNSYDSNSTVVDGISYLEDITSVNRSEIGSEPVKICFCNYGVPDCNYHQQTIRIPKGKRFPISLVAVDQVGHPINATIHSFLQNVGGGIGRGQDIQNTTKACTELNFNLVSPYDKEELIMFARGPCMTSPQSQRRLNVHFTACDYCPIGFEQHIEMTVCECVCDSRLEPYITKCNAITEQLERVGNFWVTYIKTADNTTSGYVIYPHCPFNYCIPPNSKVQVNLNIPGGENVQCVDGRSGPLCGVCWSNLSLSLGSPRCVPCLGQWPMGLAVILIASFIAGIALVALLLVFNLTIAVGTLNGIIFYANIIAANSSAFLPFSTPNFVTMLISWLNLEIGFDTCFFPGMDAYWKTLLQLAFPIYVIFLVVMVIVISEHSTRFARLVARNNPVATLATLILLSYTKFLNTVIVSLSFAILHYPNGSDRWVWLPDATIPYLKGKHIALFVISILIILAGVIYTALLLFWQLLLKHQERKAFMWTKHQKLCHFIEPYHAPYTFEQRYWTGLLLLARVLVYVVSAINVTGDPRVALVSTVIIVSSLPVMKAIMERKIYKTWLIGFMEITMHINIIIFTAFTWYTFDAKENQAVVAYTSVILTFTLLLAVLVYHIFRYTGLLSIVQIIAKKLLAFKNNCNATYGLWHVRIPGNEHSEPLVTESSVEIPKFLESPESTEIELSTSAQYKAPAIKIRSDAEAVSSSMKGSEYHQEGEGDINV